MTVRSWPNVLVNSLELTGKQSAPNQRNLAGLPCDLHIMKYTTGQKKLSHMHTQKNPSAIETSEISNCSRICQDSRNPEISIQMKTFLLPRSNPFSYPVINFYSYSQLICLYFKHHRRCWDSKDFQYILKYKMIFTSIKGLSLMFH